MSELQINTGYPDFEAAEADRKFRFCGQPVWIGHAPWIDARNPFRIMSRARFVQVMGFDPEDLER